MNKKFLILIILNLFLASAAFAQFPAEFFANSMNPIPNGPTTAPQTAQLLLDVVGGPSPSGIFVTASVSNQQYVGVNTTPDNAVVMFGATDNPNFGQTFARPRPTFAPMTEIGNAMNSMFSNVQTGEPVGIEVDRNYAFNMFSSVQHFAGLTPGSPTINGKPVPATNSRVYFADLTLTFSSPLTNPYIHLVALGGRSSAGLGFSDEFNLITPGITLEKVQGTASLVVTGAQINNANTTGIDINCPNNAAACGTVRLRGNNITTVTFQVYIRGDGDDPTTWGDTRFHTGDQWMMGVSIPGGFQLTAASAAINGKIINSSGRGLKDVTLTATALSTGEKFYATPDSYGNYRFADLPISDSYLVQAKSRYFKFEPDSKIVTLNGDLADIDFTAVSAGKTRGGR